MAQKRLLTDITFPSSGALLSIILQLSYNPGLLKTDAGLLYIAGALIPSFVSGALFGWLFGIAISLRNTATNLENQLVKATEKLDNINEDFLDSLKSFFKRDPFSMMLITTPHTGVLGSLIKDSLSSGYKKIYNVDENQYLVYLQEAICHASIYMGIQRHPIRWFKETTGGQRYLEELRDRNMSKKCRIFVISDNEVNEMKEDIENRDLLEYYWKTTGASVETFWLSEKDLKETYGFNSLIEDCAFYDEQLLIKYNPNNRILHFDVMTDGVEVKIFNKLKEQLRTGKQNPFQVLRVV